MKALTISQPFASLIASGEKWIENRTWPTVYRGPLAIHAGLGRQYLSKKELEAYPTGSVIAIARLAACLWLGDIRSHAMKQGYGSLAIANTSRTWSEAVSHKHAEGPWCWILEDVQAIDPVPYRGAQGLWDWQAVVSAE